MTAIEWQPGRDLLRVHGMAHTVVNGSALTEPVRTLRLETPKVSCREGRSHRSRTSGMSSEETVNRRICPFLCQTWTVRTGDDTGEWTPEQVRGILCNPIYAGIGPAMESNGEPSHIKTP